MRIVVTYFTVYTTVHVVYSLTAQTQAGIQGIATLDIFSCEVVFISNQLPSGLTGWHYGLSQSIHKYLSSPSRDASALL